MSRTFRHALAALWPKFWARPERVNPYQTFTNYRRIWFLSIFLLAMAALVPLTIVTLIDYELNRRAVRLEAVLRTVRLASNLRRSLTYFLNERLSALKFTVHEESFAKLRDSNHLQVVLKNLKRGFGGFTDLGVIDARGNQVAYAVPFRLTGKNYGGQAWFVQCGLSGTYISEVFLGYRDVPHMIIAVKTDLPDGSFYILRATLDTDRLIQTLYSFGQEEYRDVFLINRAGVIQTPSKYHGKPFRKLDLPVPPFSLRTKAVETTDRNGRRILVGYAYISDSPYILLLIKAKAQMMQTWFNLRTDLVGIVALSLFIIVIIILVTSTFLVNKVYEADQTKAETMLGMEHTSQLASIGRLAAGVAHEINNPLAVINEEAGLIKDLFTIERKYEGADELMEHVDSILDSVERCGVITKQLLGFARHFQVEVRPIDLGRVIREILNFLKKEAEYRNIQINVHVPPEIPDILSDRGKLQQVLLNLVNNSFQAMKKGGVLDIRAGLEAPDKVTLTVTDNGTGIPEQDIKKIFEPFYSTRGMSGGTGLGLSITYGLVRKLGGTITVKSQVGVGTTFTITLPRQREEVS